MFVWATCIHHLCIHPIHRYILRTEGAGALFKGLSLSLMGSIPTRAIYFSSYNQFKNVYESLLPKDSAGIFLFSAMSAGIVTSTATCPLWMVKTQLQLNDKYVKQCFYLVLKNKTTINICIIVILMLCSCILLP